PAVGGAQVFLPLQVHADDGLARHRQPDPLLEGQIVEPVVLGGRLRGRSAAAAACCDDEQRARDQLTGTGLRASRSSSGLPACGWHLIWILLSTASTKAMPPFASWPNRISFASGAFSVCCTSRPIGRAPIALS